MQGAYSAEMEERPYRAHRRARLQQLLDRFGGPKALQAVSGVTDTHLTACVKGRRGIGDDMACSLEKAADAPFGWMDTDPALDAGSPPDEVQLLSMFRALGPQERARALAVMAAAFPASLLPPDPSAGAPGAAQPGEMAPPIEARHGAPQL